MLSSRQNVPKINIILLLWYYDVDKNCISLRGGSYFLITTEGIQIPFTVWLREEHITEVVHGKL